MNFFLHFLAGVQKLDGLPLIREVSEESFRAQQLGKTGRADFENNTEMGRQQSQDEEAGETAEKTQS